jgi:hypothetical protein
MEMEKLKVEASSRPSTGQSNNQSRKTLILQRQRILFSCYRTDQFGDPEGYLASLGMVLEQYPDEVIEYVTDPRTGVQRRSDWPPTICKIVEACDARVSELRSNEQFRNWGSRNAPLLEAPRESRPTLDEMKAKYGDNWGLTRHEAGKETNFRAPTAEELGSHYSKFGLRFKPKKGEAAE